jgi:hypothetical protein
MISAIMARWRIRKCCRSCGKWELMDRQYRSRVVARGDTHAEMVLVMDLREMGIY